MKKIFFFIFFFSISVNVFAKDNFVYLDVQYIIDNSLIGKSYKTKLKKIEEDNIIILQEKKNIIKIEDEEIKSKKNILKKEEIDSKIRNLNKILQEYQTTRNTLNKNLENKKKDYTKNILKLLNPILTKFVEDNKIDLVLDKKNILVGIKTLDITDKLLILLDEETKDKKLINEN